MLRVYFLVIASVGHHLQQRDKGNLSVLVPILKFPLFPPLSIFCSRKRNTPRTWTIAFQWLIWFYNRVNCEPGNSGEVIPWHGQWCWWQLIDLIANVRCTFSETIFIISKKCSSVFYILSVWNYSGQWWWHWIDCWCPLWSFEIVCKCMF